ncbi:MAG: hypothetical protein AB7S81_04330 [Bdellovibrionales bacterium]
MRSFPLLALAAILTIVSTSAEAKQLRYTQNIFNDLPFDSMEQTFDILMNISSAVVGAPHNGRALEADNTQRTDAPSAFERRYSKLGKQGMYSPGSSRKVEYTPLTTTVEARPPQIMFQSAPSEQVARARQKRSYRDLY